MLRVRVLFLRFRVGLLQLPYKNVIHFCATKCRLGCLLVIMDTADNNRLHFLREGQLWKVEHGYVYIVELGKRLIHYKMLRHPSARAAVTQMIRIEALLNYLKKSEAKLMGNDDPSPVQPAAFAA